MIFEVSKCTPETWKKLYDDEPACAEGPAINTWLEKKRMYIHMLNEKLDFQSYEEKNIRQNEIWLPSVSLENGKFHDYGFRFRKNQFVRNDEIAPFFTSKINYFYDVLTFSSDSFDVVHDKDFTMLAEMWFWLNADKAIHARVVYSFQDWLGQIGGFTFGLMGVCKLLLGGYMNFNMHIEVMNVLYGDNKEKDKEAEHKGGEHEGGEKEKNPRTSEDNEKVSKSEIGEDNDKEEENLESSDAKIKTKQPKLRKFQSFVGAGSNLKNLGYKDFTKINTFTRVYIYVFSTLRCFNLLSKGNKHIKQLKHKLDHGRKNLYEDFNLKNI